MPMMRIFAAAILCLLLLMPQVSVTAGNLGEQVNGPADGKRPNIILLVTDDLEEGRETLATMPNLQQLLVAQGMRFTNAIVTMPSCCPSRASILTGKYVHNHHVIGNVPPNGGYPRFLAYNDETQTIGTMLQAAGYRTVMLGKYLNYYPLDSDPNHIPPGWSEWYVHVRGGLFRTYNLNENGTWVKYSNVPENYSTDLYRDKAVDFIVRHISEHSDQPFFLLLNPYAPHYPAHAAERHAALFQGVKAPRTAAYNEQDVSDKPAWVRKLAPLTAEQKTFVDNFYVDRLRSMQAVDDMIGALYQTLVDSGELANTYFIFTSDNGMHLGEHRIVYGKGTAYDASIRVPLIVRGPGIPAHSQQDAVISLVDLAPTFGAIAGLPTLPFTFDGRSMMPLWEASGAADQPTGADGRTAVLFDNPGADSADGSDGLLWVALDAFLQQAGMDADRRDPNAYFDDEYRIEIGKDGVPYIAVNQATGKPETTGGMASVGFRTATYKYVEYKNGDQELYDLVNDPLELENQAANAAPALLRDLSVQLAAFSTCAGDGCRIVDRTIPAQVFPLTDDWVTPTGTAPATITPTASVTPASTAPPSGTVTQPAPTSTATPVSTPTATLPVTTPLPSYTPTPVPTATLLPVGGEGGTPEPQFRQWLPWISRLAVHASHRLASRSAAT